MPLSDALLTAPADLDGPEAALPARRRRSAPSCSLVQILETVSPEALFVDNNLVLLVVLGRAAARTAAAHALNLIEQRELDAREPRRRGRLATTATCCKNFVEHGIPVLGIDPAPAQADAAIEAGVPTLQAFFDADLARRLRAEGKRADVIVANNVMAHTPTCNGFVAGLRTLLTDDGVATIENTVRADLIDHCEFDTIYHEHFCYFSCTAVDALLRRHGLFLNDVEHFPALHGGTLRWYVGHREDVQPSARAYLDAERAPRPRPASDYYRELRRRASRRSAATCATLLADLKAEGAASPATAPPPRAARCSTSPASTAS